MITYDIVIIGAGPGGYVAAIKAAHMGAKVALIEKNMVGGVCLNSGCIPTKSLIKSAEVFQNAKSASNFGINIDKNTITFDWVKILEKKNDVVRRLTQGVKTLIEKNKISFFSGQARVNSASSVIVNGTELKTKNIILATGASPIIPSIPGLKEAVEKNIVLTSKEILDIDSVPKSLVIVGGGVIGIEFATIFSTFGSEVSIIEKEDNVLVNLDDEVRNAYLRILRKAKINVLTNASVTRFNNNTVYYTQDNEEKTITTEKVLLSVGMRPNTSGLEHLGLEINNGIVVNEKLETNIKGIYAIGDCNGKMMLAHVASAEGIISVENIMGKNSTIDYNKAPAGIYSFPEIAMVGLTEQEAKKQNLNYSVSKFPLAANGKALVEGQTDGFVKIISDNKYGEILGVHILGENATDLIAEAVTAMELEATVYELAKSIHPHPTLSESIMEAAHKAIHHPIHTL